MNKFVKLLFIVMTSLSLNTKNISSHFNHQVELHELQDRAVFGAKKVLSNELQLLNFDENTYTPGNMHLSHTCYFEYTYFACVSSNMQKIVKAKSNHPINLCVEIIDDNNTRFYKDGIARGENEIQINVPFTKPIKIYFKGDPSYTFSNVDIDVSFVRQSMIASGAFSNAELQDLASDSILPDRVLYGPQIETISDALESKAFEQDVVLYYHKGSSLIENNELYLKNENMFFPNEIDFSKTKLAIWGAAGTAGEGPSIAQYAASQGAQISIGFTSIFGEGTFPLIKEFVKFFVINYSNFFFRSKPINEIINATLNSMRKVDRQKLVDFDVIKIYGDDAMPIDSSLSLPQSDDSFQIPNQDSLIFVSKNYAESEFDASVFKTLPIDTTQPFDIQDNAGFVKAKLNTNYRFAFVPPTTGYYTVEAYGRDKIYLCVDNIYRQIFDGGEETKDNNAKITFLARSNDLYLFHVKRDGSLVSDAKDYIYLKVKKAEAYSLFNYLDVDFHVYGKENIKKFKTYSAETLGYFDYHVHNLLPKDNLLAKLNNEIMYINGPLNNNLDLFASGNTITTEELPVLNNNKLMIWDLSQTLSNISTILDCDSLKYAHQSYKNGSKCSIGLYYETESIDDIKDARIVKVASNLFEKILVHKNKSVYECLILTQNEMGLSNNYLNEHIYIYGNPYIKVFSETESNNTFPIDNYIYKSNLSRDN